MPRGKHPSDHERREAVRLFAESFNAAKVAEQTGLSAEYVMRLVRASGLSTRRWGSLICLGRFSQERRPLPLNEQAFAEPLSDEAVYWIGFLMADGCVSIHKLSHRPVVSLCLQGRDASHVWAFRRFLQSGHNVGVTKRGHAKFSVVSDRLAADLARYGVRPCKSLTAEVFHLENKALFWRGVVDGDGTVGVYRNLARLNLVGSDRMTDQFRGFVQAIAPWYSAKKVPYRRVAGIYTVQVTGRAAAEVLRALYDSNCPVALPRKREAAARVLYAYAGVNCSVRSRRPQIRERLRTGPPAG